MVRINKFPCRWTSCERCFDNPEDLFNHLSDDHVGRKATNNLCLQCQWNDCGIVAAKRDHLASHLRVHLPLKRKKKLKYLEQYIITFLYSTSMPSKTQCFVYIY